MLKLVAFAGLLALCAAQVSPPKIPETFTAKFHVEIHRRDLTFGVGMMERDQTAQKAVENITIDLPDIKDTETMYQLEDYTTGKIYNIRGLSKDPERCGERDTDGKTLPKFWDWLMDPKTVFRGNRTIEHRTVNVWELNLGSVQLLLGTDTDATSDPNVPAILYRRELGTDYMYTFDVEDFKPGSPPPGDFKIPSECPTDSPRKY